MIIDLRRFATNGMTLLGRLRGVAEGRLLISDNLEDSLAQGDAWFESFKVRMDDYAQQNGMGPPEHNRTEAPPALPAWSQPVNELDLSLAEITSVVWCSGFRYDFSWIELPVLNKAGEPIHERGVTSRAGLYFLGLRRTYAVSSALLAGVGNDAAFLAERIATKS